MINRPGQALSSEDIARKDLEDLQEAELSAAEKAAAKAKAEEAELTPAEKWKRNIGKLGLAESDARTILRQILRTGYWEKEYSLFQGELVVVLRTRTAYARQRVAHALDLLQKPIPVDVAQQFMYRLNLTGSLYKYDNVTLPHLKRDASDEDQAKAFDERLEFIDKGIPEPVLTALFQQLSNFDNIAAAVTSEGAVPGF